MNLGFIQEFFNPTSVLDIGANRGQFYNDTRPFFPNAEYFLIEANPECEEPLKTLGVSYYIGAISDSERTATFYKSKADSMGFGNSFYKEKTDYYNSENLIEVEYKTTTLAKLFPNQIFDLVKIDVQGSELDIIKGGLSLIKAAKGLILEVSVVEYNENAPLEPEVNSFMEEIGFRPERTLGAHFNPITKEFIQKDMFFLNKNL